LPPGPTDRPEECDDCLTVTDDLEPCPDPGCPDWLCATCRGDEVGPDLMIVPPV
jgi:hypothetical protein